MRIRIRKKKESKRKKGRGGGGAVDLKKERVEEDGVGIEDGDWVDRKSVV